MKNDDKVAMLGRIRVLCEQLRVARVKKHLTQADLAGISGIPQPVISEIERAIRPPSLSRVMALAEALGLEVTLRSSEKENEEGKSEEDYAGDFA